MKKIAILQSSYIPWKGYFDIIHDVDLFLFFDDVQFTTRDWRTRNKIKTANGPVWLTIPAGSNTKRLICEVDINDSSWAAKHWKTIAQSYARAPYFKTYQGFFEHIYLGSQWANLSALNQHVTVQVAKELLGIKTEFADSREYSAEGRKTDRLLDLVLKAGATHYLSGPAARDYIDPAVFAEANIELEYKSYSGYPEYPQLYPPFEHAVSVVDLLFNTGPDAPYHIWGWRGHAKLEQ
jgi:WbqC-like protein family